ncbi:hypothetical protein [Pantoea agglomerans]
MHEKLLELREKLDNLHTALEELDFPYEDLNSWNTTHFPSIETADLVYIPHDLSKRVSRFKKFVPSEDDIILIDSMVAALDKSKENVDNLVSGNITNASQSISGFLLTMFFVSNSISELFSFEVLLNRQLLPKGVMNRLSLFDDNLEELKHKAGDIEHKIKTIIEAYDAAEGLPTTVKSLRTTNAEIEILKSESSISHKDISDYKTKAEVFYEELSQKNNDIAELSEKMKVQIKDYMQSYKDEAQSYIDNCEIAFRTTTTKGLAGAFQDKAQKLNSSIRWWVGGLTLALGVGAGVGYFRLQVLEQYLSNPEVSSLKLIIQLILSIMSVGAPLWFAWLATKQIGQRFRLAEDYEFKASVSKAYEGYRKEAISLDSSFAQRLFGNALTRLEEPPLRFVEENAHSSPMMEMISSTKFKDFIAKGGDAMDSVLQRAGLSREGSEVFKPKRNEKKLEQDEPVAPIREVNVDD